jgi:hypothetical protein
MDKIHYHSTEAEKQSVLSSVLAKCNICSNGCMKWTGRFDKSGYGILSFNGKSKRAHRVVALLSGSDISGRKVVHKCGDSSCCNPDHIVVIRTECKNSDLSKKTFKPLYSRGRYPVSRDRVHQARSAGKR